MLTKTNIIVEYALRALKAGQKIRFVVLEMSQERLEEGIKHRLQIKQKKEVNKDV